MQFPKNFIRATEKFTTFEEYVPAPYFRKNFKPEKVVKSAEI